MPRCERRWQGPKHDTAAYSGRIEAHPQRCGRSVAFVHQARPNARLGSQASHRPKHNPAACDGRLICNVEIVLAQAKDGARRRDQFVRCFCRSCAHAQQNAQKNGCEMISHGFPGLRNVQYRNAFHSRCFHRPPVGSVSLEGGDDIWVTAEAGSVMELGEEMFEASPNGQSPPLPVMELMPMPHVHPA